MLYWSIQRYLKSGLCLSRIFENNFKHLNKQLAQHSVLGLPFKHTFYKWVTLI